MVVLLTYAPRAAGCLSCAWEPAPFPSATAAPIRAAVLVAQRSAFVLVPLFLLVVWLRWRRATSAGRRDLAALWVAACMLALIYLTGAFASQDTSHPFGYLLWELQTLFNISCPDPVPVGTALDSPGPQRGGRSGDGAGAAACLGGVARPAGPYAGRSDARAAVRARWPGSAGSTPTASQGRCPGQARAATREPSPWSSAREARSRRWSTIRRWSPGWSGRRPRGGHQAGERAAAGRPAGAARRGARVQAADRRGGRQGAQAGGAQPARRRPAAAGHAGPVDGDAARPGRHGSRAGQVDRADEHRAQAGHRRAARAGARHPSGDPDRGGPGRRRRGAGRPVDGAGARCARTSTGG